MTIFMMRNWDCADGESAMDILGRMSDRKMAQTSTGFISVAQLMD
ncbi:hypothetical protein ACJJIE_17925 [Microbulbifer sp. TRSA001]